MPGRHTFHDTCHDRTRRFTIQLKDRRIWGSSWKNAKSNTPAQLKTADAGQPMPCHAIQATHRQNRLNNRNSNNNNDNKDNNNNYTNNNNDRNNTNTNNNNDNNNITGHLRQNNQQTLGKTGNKQTTQITLSATNNNNDQTGQILMSVQSGATLLPTGLITQWPTLEGKEK
ncbi:unnamed protein product [Polarella glacialis]|uniref:Uncharacterized protein n=1 Tax=Polarella glacialis TaxID=89957 RepID=A0A813KWT1_POLGL|nr:unnamed protein product [Polarella glacialis]